MDTIPPHADDGNSSPAKRCSKCRREFPATPEFFYRQKAKKDGLAYDCKQCHEKSSKSHFSPEGKKRRNAYSRAYGPIRRARKKALQDIGAHTGQQIQEQLKRQRCRCYYCQAKFERRYIYHVDHTFPISRASGDDPINDISYLVLACPTCNLKKNDKFPWEFPEGGRLL